MPTAGVPRVWDVALNGRPYMLDGQFTGPVSTPIQRAQADQSAQAGAGSLNRDFWRRSATSWHRGAGQDWFDREASDPARYRDSIGVWPWTRGSIRPTSSVAGTAVLAAGVQDMVTSWTGRTFAAATSGALVRVSADDGQTWANATGLPAGWGGATGVGVLAVDDANLYIATGSGGIYRGAVSGAAFTSWNATVLAVKIWNLGGRLLAATTAGELREVTGPATSALVMSPGSGATFPGAVTGQRSIYVVVDYAAASTVWRINIRSDGTGLDVPVPSVTMPRGERIIAITESAGFVMLATTNSSGQAGWRLCRDDGLGLIVGPRVTARGAPVAFSSEASYVIGLFARPSALSSNLGTVRINLGEFTGALTPAWAADLSVPDSSALTPTCLTTAGGGSTLIGTTSGVYRELAGIASPTGVLLSGWMDFGLSDTVSLSQFVSSLGRGASNPGASIRVTLIGDSNDWSATRTVTSTMDPATWALTDAWTLTGTRVSRTEVQVAFTRLLAPEFWLDAGDPVLGPPATAPTFADWTLLGSPAPQRSESWVLPLRLQRQVTTRDGQTREVNGAAELATIRGLVATGSPVTIDIGDASYTGWVEDFEMRNDHLGSWGSRVSGTLLVKIKTVIQ